MLAARVRDYEPAMLDELTASGEVIWAGHGELPGSDGWVSLHLADQAHLTLPEPDDEELPELGHRLLTVLSGGGGFFFRQLFDQVTALGEPCTDAALADALWQLVWSGHVGNDTLAPLRALTSSGAPSHRSRRRPPRARIGGRLAVPPRVGPPGTAGRWGLLPERETDPTRRTHARAEALLERHGVVTRGAVASERLPGGFAAIYKVLSAWEESGRCRRGYFVAGLGAAQFGTSGAVDRLRSHLEAGDSPTTLTLAATDPASPYGAALPGRLRKGATDRDERRAHWWCSSTVDWCSMSNAVVVPCSPTTTPSRS
uniref:Lhr family helicase n=1 Tax=Nocardioides alcanivorans TaxID=2897352 RepID=UPI00289CA082|nr:hypothetical protein [Nocardioides alcanivorans]